jgi:hypothetical protein
MNCVATLKAAFYKLDVDDSKTINLANMRDMFPANVDQETLELLLGE